MNMTFTATVAKTRNDIRNHKTRTTVEFRDLKSAKFWVLESLKALGKGSFGKIDTQEQLTGHRNSCLWGRTNIDGQEIIPRNNL